MSILPDARTAGSEAAQAGALRESEARFRNTFENAAVGMAHVAPDGRWLRVNRQVSEIVGYAPEELLKITFQDITHADDLDIDLGLLDETIRGERDTYRIEKRYWHKDGHIVWVNLTVSCVRRNSGEVDYFISVLEDISEQKRMHEALAASEARFRAVQQTTPDGFCIFQSMRNEAGGIEDFRLEFANPTSIRMFGRPEEELIGNTLRTLLPQIFEAGIFDLYEQVVDSGNSWQGEYRYPGLGGEEWYRVTTAKLDDGFAVSFADVTGRKIAEERLRQSDQRLRSILNNVMAFVGLLSPDGTMLEGNHTALAAAGIDRAEVVGKPFWETYWWSYDPQVQATLRADIARAAAGERVRRDVVVRTSGEGRATIDFQLAPIFDDAGRVVNIVPSGVDISERQRAEAHREMLMKELSHRVKNTLATVQTMASHTLREATDLDTFRDAFVGRLMAISKSHDLLMDPGHRDADLYQLVHDQVMPYARSGSAQVRLSGPPLRLGAEAAHAFGLVLHELATNAAKYGALSTETGGLEIAWSESTDRDIPEALVDWREYDGPPVSPPARQGFGSILIEQSLSYSLGGSADIDYRPEGVHARFRFPRKDPA